MRPKSPVRGDRPNGTSSTAPPPRSRPGEYQNRNGPPRYDNRQTSFRPPRTQPPPSQPSWTSGPDSAAGPYAPYNSTWGNIPPRMHALNSGPEPEASAFAMNWMSAEINAVQNGLYQPSGPNARFLGPTPPDVWTPHGYQPHPPPRQQPMPRFQQYQTNMDQDFNTTLRPAEQQFYPPYPNANLQYQAPPRMQAAFHGHQNPTSFIHPGNGQYYNNSQTPTGNEGYAENGAQRGYQQWSQ
jgi:hypothetical protein